MKTETERGCDGYAMKALWRLCASVAFFGVVSRAFADVVTVTYSGTVAGGYGALSR
jgi:hypothetical protein